ncbi:TPA: hypothetical protein ACL01D_001691 [Campylobacter jejuni subsp. jejuni]
MNLELFKKDEKLQVENQSLKNEAEQNAEFYFVCKKECDGTRNR